MFSGPGGCHCGGRCNGLGDDTHVDPVTGCVVDNDGVQLTCPGGVDPNFNIGNQAATITGAPPLPSYVNMPGGQAPTVSTPGIVQSIISAFTQKPVVTAPAPVQAQSSSLSNFLTGKQWASPTFSWLAELWFSLPLQPEASTDDSADASIPLGHVAATLPPGLRHG